MRSGMLLALLGAIGSAAELPPSYDDWDLHLLSEATGAVCLDGSAPGYYMRTGGVRSKALIHFQGGGWCTSLVDCAARANTSLGSSSSFARDKATILSSYDGGAHGLFSSDPLVNPQFHNWTKVYVRYCDGASFGGDVEKAQVVHGQTIYFRGRRVLDAVMADLIVNQAFGVSTDLIINGCSAGGLAIWLHLDYIASKFTGHTRVYGVPECGLFMDEPDASGRPKWTPIYAAVDAMQNVTGSGSADAGCLAAAGPLPAERSKCFLAQHSLPYVTTPYYAVNSVYDAWQGSNILGLPSRCMQDARDCTRAQAAAFESLRANMLGNLSAGAAMQPQSSYFTYNCATHCSQLAHDDRWGELLNAEHTMSLRESLGRWYDEVRGGLTPVATNLTSVAARGWGADADKSCRSAPPRGESGM